MPGLPGGEWQCRIVSRECGRRRLDSCRSRARNQQPDSFRHGPRRPVLSLTVALGGGAGMPARGGLNRCLIRSRASGLPESGPRGLPGLSCKATFPRRSGGAETAPSALSSNRRRRPGVFTGLANPEFQRPPAPPEFSPAWRPRGSNGSRPPGVFTGLAEPGFHRPQGPRTATSSKTTSDHERKEPC